MTRWAILFPLLVLEVSAQRPRLSRTPPAAEEFDAKSVSVSGTVISADAKTIVVDAADHRIFTFKLTKSTKLPAATPQYGDRVHVNGTQDQELYLTATDVVLDQSAADTATTAVQSHEQATSVAGKAAAPAPSQPPVIYKPAKPDPDDEGPPLLRRGKPNPPPAKAIPAEDPAPVTRAASASNQETQPTGNAGPESANSSGGKTAEDSNTALLDRAREWALNFTESLPNYVCQQFTTRYLKQPGQRDWLAKDVVSANVVYENGKEDYRNIAINGKSQSKRMEDLPGSWSTGEFGTTLRSLFHPSRRASFRYVKQTQITGMTASVFDYSVKRENSDWRVQLGGQAIIPAYSGRVWIDRKTARVIRIEMQADEIPKDFPLDRVEAANDYGLIRLATADQYMLPLHAETLSCERGSTFCSRNAIEFRNYHKYSGEATITF